jgi:MoaA/NifB/PqqE/SkfB family radical SAM enzyme
MMDGGNRAIPCAYDRYVLSLYPTGEVLPCSRESWIHFGNIHEKSVDEIWFGEDAKKIRKRMKKEVCPRCNFYCGVEFALRKEFFTYCTYYVKSRLSSLLHAFRSSQRARPSPKIHI